MSSSAEESAPLSSERQVLMDAAKYYLEDDLIEGFGNEALLLGVFVLGAIVLALIWFICHNRYDMSRVSRQYIHPANLIAVNDARNTSQQQQRSSGAEGAAAMLSNQQQQQRTRFGTMDSNCPVCLNQLTLPIETNCGHLFCGRCIIIYWQHAQWRGGPIRCPVCRQQVSILLPCFPTNMHSHSDANAPSLASSIALLTTEWINYLLSFLGYPSPSNTSGHRAGSSSSSSSLLQDTSQQQHQNGHHRPSPQDDLRNSSPLDSAPSPPTAAQNAQTERTNVIREINSYNRRFSGEPRPWSDYLYDLPTLLRHLTQDFFSFNGLMYMFRLRIVLCVAAAIMYLISPLDMIPEAVFGIFGLFDDIVVLLLLAIYVTIIYRRFLSSRWEMD